MLHKYIFQRDNFLMNRNYTIVKRDWRFRKKKRFRKRPFKARVAYSTNDQRIIIIVVDIIILRAEIFRVQLQLTNCEQL